LDAVGGWESMQETVSPQYLNMWELVSDPDFSWLSLLINSTIVGIWYWLTDQYIVQRTTARNIKEGRRGTIWSITEITTCILIPDSGYNSLNP